MVLVGMRALAGRLIGGRLGVASGADPSCETSFSDTETSWGVTFARGWLQLLCRNANSRKFSNLQVLMRRMPRCGANAKSRFRDVRARVRVTGFAPRRVVEDCPSGPRFLS